MTPLTTKEKVDKRGLNFFPRHSEKKLHLWYEKPPQVKVTRKNTNVSRRKKDSRENALVIAKWKNAVVPREQLILKSAFRYIRPQESKRNSYFSFLQQSEQVEKTEGVQVIIRNATC